MSKSDNVIRVEQRNRMDDLICFALYSATHTMNRTYKPHLSALGLTYPQYITLMALWEKDGVTVGKLCNRLLTETSTLTPLLKRLENRGYVKRKRGKTDERQVFIHLTDSGKALEKKAPQITNCITSDIGLSPTELKKAVCVVNMIRSNLLENQNF